MQVGLARYQKNFQRKEIRAELLRAQRNAISEVHPRARVHHLPRCVGLGKTHLATALNHTACLKGYTVLFTTAVDVINTLNAAQQIGQQKAAFNYYLKPAPALLILDELGYLPIDKAGVDLRRYFLEIAQAQ